MARLASRVVFLFDDLLIGLPEGLLFLVLARQATLGACLGAVLTLAHAWSSAPGKQAGNLIVSAVCLYANISSCAAV